MNYSHCKAVYLAYFHTLFYKKKTTCFVVDLYKKLKRYTKNMKMTYPQRFVKYYL